VRKPVPEIASESTVQLSTDGTELTFYDSVEAVVAVDEHLFGHCSPFLGNGYLWAVENAAPAHFSFLYGIVRQKGEPVAALFFQAKPISIEESLQDEGAGHGNSWKNAVKKWLSFNVMVCGSLLNSGELGLACKPHFPEKLLPHCIHAARTRFAERGIKTGFVLVKDFYGPARERIGPVLQGAGYHELSAQPAMWMDLDPAWRTFDDYLDALHSKYRIRAKRALKKSADILRTELTLQDVLAQSDLMYRLYNEVAKGAGFNTFSLSPDYFAELKRQLPDTFKVFGYWLDGELVAFYTALLDRDRMEAHFLGMRQDLNHDLQIYMNILFDLVKIGIYHRVPSINFARTALEIKSSVGAQPRPLYFYLWSANPLLNLLVPRLYRTYNPDLQWLPRHPFKTDD
jgi:hypothetical protein